MLAGDPPGAFIFVVILDRGVSFPLTVAGSML